MIFLAVVGVSFVRTIAPLYYKKFFDAIYAADAATSDLVHTLTLIIVSLLGVQILAWALRRTQGFLSNDFVPRVTADLANACFSALHAHSYRFFTNQFIGALVRRANRLVDAFEGIAEQIIEDVLPLAVRIGTILAVLFWRNTQIGVLLAAWIAVYLVINYFFTRYKLPYDVKAAETDSEVTARLADTLTNNVNIKVFTGFRNEARDFRNHTDKQFRIWRFSLNLNEAMNAMQGMLMILIEFLILFAAIRLWGQGRLTPGDFVLIQIYLIQVFDRLWNFGTVIRRIYKYLADAEEMTGILNTPAEVQDKPAARELAVREGNLAFHEVHFTYTKTRAVLKNFNLLVRQGERVGLVGLSGAGKSTIAALVLRFFDVSAGAISIDEQNIADVTQESLRKNISYVPQDPVLFHRPLKENIRYGRQDARDEEIMRAAHLAHCDEFIDQLPQKYETFVGERGIKLSGGERQRIAIARAILKNAPILLLDEATSSLDSHAEAIIQDALANLMAGKTVLVIAHRLSTIMKMDRIIVMHGGKIVEEGRHEDLIKKPDGIYKKLWDIQVGGFLP